MKNYYYWISFYALLILLLAGCADMNSAERHFVGEWVPVYVQFNRSETEYVFRYTGPIDETGTVTITGISRYDPSITKDMTVRYAGLRFYQENGENLYEHLYLTQPEGNTENTQHGYRVEGDYIYLGRDDSYSQYCHDFSVFLASIMEAGQKFYFFDDDKLMIGNITYVRR